jgi:hypothetical protein
LARFPVTGVFGDGAGGIVRSGTVAVVLYGTSTPAVIYAAQAGGVGVGSVLSDSSGKYEFWVDDGDYDQTQVFEAQFSKSGGVGVGTNILVSYAFTLAGLQVSVPVITDFTDSQHDHADAAGGGSTLNSPIIASFVNATHNHGSAAGGGTALSSPVITTPTIASFVNATHDHQNAAGGGATLTSPTIVTPTIASFANANHTHASAAQGGVFAGRLVQSVSLQTGAVATGSTPITLDDSIPPNTEGDEYMSLAITPTSATNKLVIRSIFNGANSGTGEVATIALFQDSVVDAIACTFGSRNASVNSRVQLVLRHEMVSGTVSSTTFKIRVGFAVAGTTTFNGHSGGRIYGGTMVSGIWIDEYQV